HPGYLHWLWPRTRRARRKIDAAAEADPRDRARESDGGDQHGDAERRIVHTRSTVASVGPLTDGDDSTAASMFEFRGEFSGPRCSRPGDAVLPGTKLRPGVSLDPVPSVGLTG